MQSKILNKTCKNNYTMYAIVDIAGQQFKVTKEQKIFVHRLDAEEGSNITFSSVLLVDNDGDIKVGLPTVEGVSINAKVLAHVKGDKVLVFKKKRRKGYQKLNGHRQYLTQLLIEDIVLGNTTQKATKTKAKKVSETENINSEE